MMHEDTENDFICAVAMMYSVDTVTETLQQSINYFNTQGLVVVGAYTTRGVPYDESDIIMHVVQDGGVQLSADELLIESTGNKPWYVDEFMKRV